MARVPEGCCVTFAAKQRKFLVTLRFPLRLIQGKSHYHYFFLYVK